MTSGARRSRRSIRAGRVLTGMSLAAPTCLHSRVRSERARAQQKRANPAALSSSLRACPWPWSTVPARTLPLHEPQAPSLQP